MSAHILMALQVHADDDGFVDVAAAMRRAAVAPVEMRAALVELLKRDVLRGANTTRGVVGVTPESGFQLAEGWR